MAFLSGETLHLAIPRDKIIDPFEPSQIDCAAYTLRMGREAYITPDYQIQILSKHRIELLREHQHFIIPAGQFAFLLTEEVVNIPNDVVGFISLKTGIKFRGLINVSGFHVDPGFKGHLLYAVYNAGPSQIHLARGMSLFLIWFAKLDMPSDSIRKNSIAVENQHINPSLIDNIPGEILSMQNLSRRIDRIQSQISIIRAVGIAVTTIVAIVIAALQINWKSILGGH